MSHPPVPPGPGEGPDDPTRELPLPGQPPYGQPPYGPPPYGPAGYGGPPSGQPWYGQSTPRGAAGPRRGTAIALTVITLLVLAAAGIAWTAVWGDPASGLDSGTAAATSPPASAGAPTGTPPTASAPATSTSGVPAPSPGGIPAGQSPGDLGDDAELDALADGCWSGRMDSCDELFYRSEFGTPYEDYADTCGGRTRDSGGVCTLVYDSGSTAPTGSAPGGPAPVPPATLPPTGLGDDPDLDQLASGCFAGTMIDCDLLFLSSFADDSKAAYNDYGHTCAGRQPLDSAEVCSDAFPD